MRDFWVIRWLKKFLCCDWPRVGQFSFNCTANGARFRDFLGLFMSNRMKARAIKILHYSWYFKILSNCTRRAWRLVYLERIFIPTITHSYAWKRCRFHVQWGCCSYGVTRYRRKYFLSLLLHRQVINPISINLLVWTNFCCILHVKSLYPRSEVI